MFWATHYLFIYFHFHLIINPAHYLFIYFHYHPIIYLYNESSPPHIYLVPLSSPTQSLFSSVLGFCVSLFNWKEEKKIKKKKTKQNKTKSWSLSSFRIFTYLFIFYLWLLNVILLCSKELDIAYKNIILFCYITWFG